MPRKEIHEKRKMYRRTQKSNNQGRKNKLVPLVKGKKAQSVLTYLNTRFGTSIPIKRLMETFYGDYQEGTEEGTHCYDDGKTLLTRLIRKINKELENTPYRIKPSIVKKKNRAYTLTYVDKDPICLYKISEN